MIEIELANTKTIIFNNIRTNSFNVSYLSLIDNNGKEIIRYYDDDWRDEPKLVMEDFMKKCL